MIRKKYEPDILDTIANISNDEVFTPPVVVNKMLDLLPQSLFESPDTTFLDPCSKTGIFLREIARRLDKGLEKVIPNKEERIKHILTKQIYGISITHLCHLMTKRSLYCSKYANDIHSLAEGEFENEDGNIYYDETLDHDYDNKGKCKICGMTKEVLKSKSDKENYAYYFIHKTYEEIKEDIKMLKFDVIIGNPPYQISTSDLNAGASPIYQNFVKSALELQPTYLSMIIPSRWQVGGKGLDEFRSYMINDKHLEKMVDYVNSKDCFPNNDIKGGVCYFLRNEEYEGPCEITTHYENETLTSKRYLSNGDDIYIRDGRLIPIKEKCQNEIMFDSIVSTTMSYGLQTDLFNKPEKYNLPELKKERFEDSLTIYGLENLKRTKRYVNKDFPFPRMSRLNEYKIFISSAYGCGSIGETIPTPVLATPGMACTGTFLEIGAFDNEQEACNCLKYVKTKLFRLLVGLRKTTQHAPRKTYSFVPLQDFTNNSDIDWERSISEIDKQLYKKYNLTESEINLIEELIKPME